MVKETWRYLEALRRSGVVNMFGAAPYLMDEFGMTQKEATDELKSWMKNYNREDYDGNESL